MVGVKYIASVSFGKDSLAMLLRLMEEKYPLDAVVFFDTGMEFEAIYHIRDRMQMILQSNAIEYVEFKMNPSFLYQATEKVIPYRNKPGTHIGYGWCGGVCRWATGYKTRAIEEYKRNLHDSVIDYVGIAADEIPRIAKQDPQTKKLPLVEWGMTEKDCLAYCYERGFFWDENGVRLYDVLDRVSCWCCRNKNLNELRNMYKHLPAYWKNLKQLQTVISEPLKREGSVFELEQRFRLEDEWLLSGKNIRSREFFSLLNQMQKTST